MTQSRSIWGTDRYGAEIDSDISIEHLNALLDTIRTEDGDDDHRSISLTDENGWNLEFYRDDVVFENVEVGGDRVGALRGLHRSMQLKLAEQFIAGDFEALRARDWS